jgi:hypothetical protein
MQKLKDLYDAAKAADEKVKQVQLEMLTVLDDGTEEGKAAALALRPALDAAKQAADEANLLYISVRDAGAGEDPNAAARKFVPVAGAADASQGKSKTRAEFDALSAAERMSFMLGDGKIVENE